MVTISLCMIVRNEEAILSRCLNSFKEIADEIIIVDTGSEDNTKEIAKQYTKLIYDFPWINDFSAARNKSFSMATMNYCMWVDADDILPRSQCKKLLEWKNNASLDNCPDVVMLKYTTSFTEDGTPNFLYYRERLIRNSRGFLWKGRVHETITPMGNVTYEDIYLEHHSNKTYYSERNLKIYEEMISDGDTLDARDMFYYGRELYYHGQYAKAIDTLTLFLSMPNAFIENQVEACRIVAYCCYPLNLNHKALLFLLKGLSYRVPSGELCCDIGKHYMDRANYEEAIFWYMAALNAPKKTENGGFILDECYGYLPCLQLSVCYDKVGDLENALHYHSLAGTHNPNGEHFLKNKIYFNNLKFQKLNK